MFTGIIEELGQIKELSMTGHSGRLRIRASEVLEGTKLGDSIAVNGICLTVTNMTHDSFTADVMAETVSRSGLAGYKAGDLVNLERAMAANGRFGGHIVSGHIDGTGTITEMKKDENAVWVTIAASPDIMELVVEKGSICIDGISLTVARAGQKSFSVSVIPHTGEGTTLLKQKAGGVVNLETDVIGKYVKRLMTGHTNAVGAGDTDHARSSGMTMAFLEEYL